MLNYKWEKWLLLGVVALIAYWLYKRAYTVTTSTAGRLSTLYNNVRNYVNVGRKYITLLDIPSLDLDSYFTELAAMGYNGVFINVRFANIVQSNGTYDFTKYDQLINLCSQKGLEVFPNLLFKMGVGEWSNLGFSDSDRWLNSDGSLYGDGSVSARYDSPVWQTRFAPFVSAFAERYRPYYVAGWVPGISFANTKEDEFGYAYDFEPLGTPTYKEKHEILKARFSELSAAANGIPTCFHAGDFISNMAIKRGVLGFKQIANVGGWVKHNPNKSMDINYASRVVSSSGKQSILELTYTDGLTANELATQAQKAFQLGVDIVTFAFVDLAKSREIKEAMTARGAWEANKGTVPSFAYTVNVSDMIANDGYNLTGFNNAYQGGVSPAINQVYNL